MSQTIQKKILVEHVRVKTEKPFGEVAAALEARLGTFDPAVDGNVLRQLFHGSALEHDGGLEADDLPDAEQRGEDADHRHRPGAEDEELPGHAEGEFGVTPMTEAAPTPSP